MGSRNFLPKLVKKLYSISVPDDEDSAVPGGKGIDGLILDYQKLDQQAGGQLGGVKQNGVRVCSRD